MSAPPARPKIYHITHLDNLASIVAAGSVDSDTRRIQQGLAVTNIGMTKIKQRRLNLPVGCHPGTKVGEYVPFYFSPRSIMLYIIYCGNHPDLGYSGGQSQVVHFEADLVAVTQWAENNNRPWAFSKSNAGAKYTEFFCKTVELKEIDWKAVAAQDFRDPVVKEGKQAEFLLYDSFPWALVERIGVIDSKTAAVVRAAVGLSGHQPKISIQPDWYY